MSSTIDISYEITPVSPEAHMFRVSLTVQNPNPNHQNCFMPAWIPGSYMIRDFARNVVSFSATDNNGEVECHKKNKHTWVCSDYEGPLTVTYEVYAWELSVRAAHLDATHGYFNGTSVFMAVVEQEHKPCRVLINPPDGSRYLSWKVATSLACDGAETHRFGWYKASNYDDLVDHPVEMGEFALATFDVAGVPHDLALYGAPRADIDRIAKDIQVLCEHHVKLFGELPEMERYVFMCMCPGTGYGGLEHRASTSLMCSRNDLPAMHETEISEQYRNFLALCSHEYFHTWNVKRIKPAVFMPYALEHEVYTHLLWAFEGITSYYDELALRRTGLISADSYLELLAQTITRVMRCKGRFKQTVTESSFDAWTKFYKQDENAPNAIVSYYSKGAVIACALDLTIRHESGDHKSLDDVMQHLWENFGKPGKGVAETEFESIVEEVTGLDLSEFFEQALYTTNDIDLDSLLKLFGVEMQMQPAQSLADKGGKPFNGDDSKPVVDAGVRINNNNPPAITHVFDDGAAQQAGLAAGDVLIALDGMRITATTYESMLKRFKPGDSIAVTFFRHDNLAKLNMTVKAAPADTCYLELAGGSDDSRGWLDVQD